MFCEAKKAEQSRAGERAKRKRKKTKTGGRKRARIPIPRPRPRRPAVFVMNFLRVFFFPVKLSVVRSSTCKVSTLSEPRFASPPPCAVLQRPPPPFSCRHSKTENKYKKKEKALWRQLFVLSLSFFFFGGFFPL
ncbi:hypothetical protein LZ31DRAFT_187847 [Colletotrichum somersetense]|nr:hypothetical protein LZ31DRAFT_187847 [Colletotrichum somersetense]